MGVVVISRPAKDVLSGRSATGDHVVGERRPRGAVLQRRRLAAARGHCRSAAGAAAQYLAAAGGAGSAAATACGSCSAAARCARGSAVSGDSTAAAAGAAESSLRCLPPPLPPLLCFPLVPLRPNRRSRPSRWSRPSRLFHSRRSSRSRRRLPAVPLFCRRAALSSRAASLRACAFPWSRVRRRRNPRRARSKGPVRRTPLGSGETMGCAIEKRAEWRAGSGALGLADRNDWRAGMFVPNLVRLPRRDLHARVAESASRRKFPHKEKFPRAPARRRATPSPTRSRSRAEHSLVARRAHDPNFHHKIGPLEQKEGNNRARAYLHRAGSPSKLSAEP